MGIEFIVPPTTKRLEVKRNGSSITRHIPKPTIVIDSREQKPFTFQSHPNWIGGTVVRFLDAGDYSVEGMEELLRLERKSLGDLVMTLTVNREPFFRACERMSAFRYKALIVEGTYEDVKSEYRAIGLEFTEAHPNGISGSLDALEAKYGIHVIYSSMHRSLAEEKAASWLSKHFTYWYLENAGMGRVLIPGDL